MLCGQPVLNQASWKMGDQLPYSYDEVPYSNHPFAQSHPDRMATIATLFGLKPPPIGSCRILELGCGRGGNLVPMAEQLPGSDLVGIDLSAKQITEAQQWVERLEFKNIQLKQMNLADVDGSLGDFDYIICHGVFSWVPTEIQDKIFEICVKNLTPQGVAYVSYNTFPGWNMRGMIRDMMQYHSQHFELPQDRVNQSRALLDFLAKHSSDKNAFGMLLKSELETLRKLEDSYLFHEHLEEVNSPLYFHQFAERAESHGLQYLGEVEISSMYSGHFPQEVVATLENVAANLIQMEQYTDFLRNRTFRQTLLVHKDQTLDRQLRPADLESLYVASPLIPENPNVELRSREPLTLVDPPSQRSVKVSSPILKSACLILSEAWPAGIGYSELRKNAQLRFDERMVVSADQIQEANKELGTDLLQFYVSNLIQIRSQSDCFSTQAGPRPEASRVARSQVEAGQTAVTSLAHTWQALDDFARHVLRNLDGDRNRSELVDILLNLVDDQTLALQTESQVNTCDQLRDILSQGLDQALSQLARAALVKDSQRAFEK
jgi:methyltransferase-like protein/cyclopropane fatty-acyl-phospholipid synthase-like methyltransferase